MQVLIYNVVWFVIPIAALATCVVRPATARDAVEAIQAWTKRHARAIVLVVSFGVGAVLVVRGLIADLAGRRRRPARHRVLEEVLGRRRCPTGSASAASSARCAGRRSPRSRCAAGRPAPRRRRPPGPGGRRRGCARARGDRARQMSSTSFSVRWSANASACDCPPVELERVVVQPADGGRRRSRCRGDRRCSGTRTGRRGRCRRDRNPSGPVSTASSSLGDVARQRRGASVPELPRRGGGARRTAPARPPPSRGRGRRSDRPARRSGAPPRHPGRRGSPVRVPRRTGRRSARRRARGRRRPRAPPPRATVRPTPSGASSW